MKVVVTGATGLLGGYVVDRLARAGWEVVAVSRAGTVPRAPFEVPPGEGRVRGVAVDISSESAVPVLAPELGPAVSLVHLAAWRPPVTAGTSAGDRRRLIDVNVLGTLRVLDAARQAGGVEIVVYASTFEVYGRPRDLGPVTEASRLAPCTDYGVTKLSGEDHLFAFAEEQGVPVTALRMPALYGPASCASGALRTFLKAVARGDLPTIHGDGQDRCDQLHAADAALSVELSLSSQASGVYNVSDGEPHSTEELARTVLAAAGLAGKPRFLPSQEPTLDCPMSIARIRETLGFRPVVSLVEGTRQELRWLRGVEAGS